MHLSTLSAWLDWIGSVHRTDIELGLARIGIVAERLGLLSPACPVITVGGTNGKGSTVAGLQALYLAAGYKVGAFTSPYLFIHNEEVRVNGDMATDADFCQAFQKIEDARLDVSLTPFEYHTLAALLIFKAANLDVMILEVGLGGRLDAVNIINANISVVTSIGIDHQEWLGSTRERIAIEKAGIFRANKAAICGDPVPPATLAQAAKACGAIFYQQAVDFQYLEKEKTWDFSCQKAHFTDLPRNHLLTQNMATVLMTVTEMQPLLPVSEDEIRQGLLQVKLMGRLQVCQGRVTKIYDVSHNPAAVAVLAKFLQQTRGQGKTFAVFSMLADKDIPGVIAEVENEIDGWYVAPLTAKRRASLQQLETCFLNKNARFFPTIAEALVEAEKVAQQHDRIVIFGSFYTVAALLQHEPVQV